MDPNPVFNAMLSTEEGGGYRAYTWVPGGEPDTWYWGEPINGNVFKEFAGTIVRFVASAAAAYGVGAAVGASLGASAGAGIGGEVAGAAAEAGWESTLGSAWEQAVATSANQNAALASAATASQLSQGIQTAQKVVQAYSYLNRATGQRVDVAPNAPVPPGYERIGVIYMSDAQDLQSGAPANSGAVATPAAGGIDNTAALAIGVIALFVLYWLSKGKG